MGNLFSELKRRNVVRVGLAYIVIGWVVLQVGDVLFEMFGTPDWVGKTVAAILLLGFPFAVIFAWAFELTPEGVKRTEEVDRSESITHSTGKKLNLVIIGALVVALGYFVWERQQLVEPGIEDEAVVDKSIAVLPFVNMSSDQEQEWFADGLTEEILNSLARTPDLLVASRTSSFQYKGQNTDISAIARALGVAHILEGSVRRGGDRLRVTAQLIRASDGFHLWSETFDREPKDVIEIQENVAIQIANALKTAMDPEALQKMVSAGTSSVAAYEAYLEGLALETASSETGSVAPWGEAREAYDRAVEIDPAFAKAHWHRAQFWATQFDITQIGSDVSGVSHEEAFANYIAAIDAAIEHEDNDVLAQKFKGDKAYNEFNFTDARRYLESYVKAYPNDAEALIQLITVFGEANDGDSMKPYVPQLFELVHDDPFRINSVLNTLVFGGLDEEAVSLARDSVTRYPQHAFVLYQSHRALLWGGHTEEAAALVGPIRRSEFPEENVQLVLLRQACAEGDLAAAEQHFESAIAAFRQDPSIQFIGLQILGRPDEAHRLLIDGKLDKWAAASFLNYPYFNHTLFPELAAALEQQGIDRKFIESPPYACKAGQS